MKTKIAILTAITTLAIAIPASASAGWHVVKSQSASGGYAVTTTSATVNRPHRIAVQFTHGSGDVVWTCSRGYSASSWSRNYSAGWHELRNVWGKDTCDVAASVGGSGRVTVQILTHR